MKGMVGLEFIVSTALFLGAFWFIYMQSALMLTPQMHRGDVREPAIDFFSTILADDAGIPQDWVANPTQLGFAEYTGSQVNAGILDKTKLDWANGKTCASIQGALPRNIEIAFRVTTTGKTWECTSSMPKQGSIKRPVFVRFGAAYKPAILEVWGG